LLLYILFSDVQTLIFQTAERRPAKRYLKGLALGRSGKTDSDIVTIPRQRTLILLRFWRYINHVLTSYLLT